MVIDYSQSVVKMKKSCLLCSNESFDLISPCVRDSKNHKVIKCKKCHHVQLFPIPTPEDDEKFYNENLQDKNVGDVGSIKRAYNKMIDDTQRRIELVSKLTPKSGSILEIGSGHGFFLEMMRKKGYKILGIDVSREKRKILKKVTKAKVLNVNINEQIPDIGLFDTIVFFHVLEHISDPVKFLVNCQKLLKPKGKIIVEVPNCDDFQLQFNKAYKEFYWQRAHINYFTPKILKSVFQKSGLKNTKIIGVQRYSIENMINWRLTNKPQIDEPTYSIPDHYNWIESHYKSKLEKSLKSDTIMAISG